MGRLRRHPLLVLGAIVFLALSFQLARWLSVENIERDDIVTLLVAQAHGDAAGMLAQLSGCGPGCRSIVFEDARRLKRPGSVQILADQTQTAYALTSTTGFTRIAWKSSLQILPVVQCFTVARTGNAISGISVRILRVSLPLTNTQGDCPSKP